MHTSEEGLELIEDSELFRARPYNCPAGHCTIGFGLLIHKGPVATGHPEVTDAVLKPFGLTRAQALVLEAPYANGITREKALELLHREISGHEAAICRVVKVPLDQSEFDALVDFEYNLGTGSLQNSTLLKKLNAGDYDGAANEFQKWVYANHEKLSGLAVRRAKEKVLFVRDLPRFPLKDESHEDRPQTT